MNCIVYSDYKTIAYEDFDIKAMLKKELPKPTETGFDKNNAQLYRLFHRLLADASFFRTTNTLNYKANWQRKAIIMPPKNSTTYRECNECGYVDKDLRIGTIDWECTNCSATLNKGINSTVLIERYALKAGA